MTNQSAAVHSIDAIRDFRAGVAEFAEDARSALVDIDLEVRRSLDWILELQPAYWKNEVRRREHLVNEAKNDLHRARMCTLPGGGTPSCMEEKKALSRAEQRLAEAHEKVKLVKHWARVLEHEVAEYSGRAMQLNTLLDSTVPRALSFLDRATGQLELYVATGTRSALTATPEGAGLSADSGAAVAAESTSDAVPEVDGDQARTLDGHRDEASTAQAERAP